MRSREFLLQPCRPLSSTIAPDEHRCRPPLLTLDEALARLLARCGAGRRAETVSTFDADGRVLAADVRLGARRAAAGQQLDGRLRGARAPTSPATGAVLPVSQRIPAGARRRAARSRARAARIFTGAPMPAGRRRGRDAGAVRGARRRRRAHRCACRSPASGSAAAARTCARGAVVLPRGRAADAAGARAGRVGRRRTRCRSRARPRVALFFDRRRAGDAGRAAAEPGRDLQLEPLHAARPARRRSAARCDDLGIVPDRLDATREALRARGAEQRPDRHLRRRLGRRGRPLKPAVEAEGRLDLWQIAIKPGKPLAFGAGPARRRHGWFIGLPGNPVSSFVTFLLAGAAVPAAAAGRDATGARGRSPLRADFDWPRPDRRREFLRVRRNAQGGLDLFPNQSSGVLTSTVWGDGLIDNPAGQAIARGDPVATCRSRSCCRADPLGVPPRGLPARRRPSSSRGAPMSSSTVTVQVRYLLRCARRSAARRAG